MFYLKCDESNVACSNQKVTVELNQEGSVKNYKYQVFCIDEYNNIWLVGFYNNLRDAEPAVNDFLSSYEFDEDAAEEYGTKVPSFGDEGSLGKLEEYPSTVSSCFDRMIDTTCGCVQVRGFVF